MSDETATDAQVVTQRPTNSAECMQEAARVLKFAERETDGRLFDQYITLSERWMELGINMGSSD